MRNNLSRRDFLKALAISLGSLTTNLYNPLEVNSSSNVDEYDNTLRKLFLAGEVDPIKSKYVVDIRKDGNKKDLWYVPEKIRDLFNNNNLDSQSLNNLVNDKSNYFYLTEKEMVKGIWCYPGFETLAGFEKNPDVIGRRITNNLHATNIETLNLLDDFGLNTIYISALNHFGGMDYYGAFNDRRKSWADYKEYNKLLENFALSCNDDYLINSKIMKNRKEVSILAYEDTIFLDWSKEKIKEHFEILVKNTHHFARNYQIDVEPHAVDLHKPGSFRGNVEGQKELISKFLVLCEAMYEVAQDYNVKLIPAIPAVIHPNRKKSHIMDYHSLFKELGYELGVNEIKCHELILMSYSWTNREMLETFMMKDDKGKFLFEDLKTPFTVAGTNFPNIWDPYLSTAEEFKDTTKYVKEIQKVLPMCKGYQVFCNLSLMNPYSYSEKHPYGIPMIGASIDSGLTRDILMNQQMNR
jgi:hypothetical protein